MTAPPPADALLLDTHIALWLDSGDERLQPATRSVIDECWRSGGTILLSAVTVWEIALLVDRGRIELDLPIEKWVERFVAQRGLQVVPLGYRAAAHSYRLHPLEHRDPADRLLIATAIELDCPLVTYDDRIVRFADRHGRQYRFAVAA
jgi:PIN domain nuclease of toxin-antitoxin system